MEDEEEIRYWWNNIAEKSLKDYFCMGFSRKKWEDLTEAEKIRAKRISQYR